MFRSFNFDNNFEQTTNKNLENCRNDNLDSYQKKNEWFLFDTCEFRDVVGFSFFEIAISKTGRRQGKEGSNGCFRQFPLCSVPFVEFMTTDRFNPTRV